jgi:hypothetical protein
LKPAVYKAVNNDDTDHRCIGTYMHPARRNTNRRSNKAHSHIRRSQTRSARPSNLKITHN